jgi:alpha-tubulin suppressor-like RCC1 family protein
LDKNPTIYTSPDGDVWTLRDTTIKASLRAAITIKGAIYIAGDSVIEKSTDGGATWTDTYINVGGNKLFMGLASNGKDLIAAGFNHNVWAMPLSGRPAVKGRLELPVGRGAPQIGMGYWHGIILASDGSLWAWGQNGDGWPVLGLGSLHASRKSLRQIGHDTDWVSIAVGHSHNLAIKSDGTLWGWGANFRHQLDATTNVARATPVPSAPGNDWKQAAAGAVHSLAIKKDGTLWAWGNNWAGQLGTGTVTDSPAPVQVGSANDWTRIWAKGVVSVGQRSDGSLWRWGILDGFRTNDGLLVPTRVSADTNWVDVSFGDSEVFAIQSDGTLWVWGREAQIYTGATDTRANTIPTRVGTDNDWMACAPAHGYYQVLMKKDGSLWALDATADHNPKGGVLTAAKLERIDLPGSFMAVAAGQDGIGVALKGIGEVWTWGWVADKPWQLSNIDPKNQPTEN